MTAYAEAALANLDEAIELMSTAARARTDQCMWTLLLRARIQAVNARAKLAEAMTEEEATR